MMIVKIAKKEVLWDHMAKESNIIFTALPCKFFSVRSLHP